MVRRALTRQTRWYQNRCSTFKNKDFIVEKQFWKILEFWPLDTSILTWAKKWPKWFRNDFSRAFERCLSFFSTVTRSRDHGGGGVQTPPPPPAGGGKSRGPAGRGLILPSAKIRLKLFLNNCLKNFLNYFIFSLSLSLSLLSLSPSLSLFLSLGIASDSR